MRKTRSEERRSSALAVSWNVTPIAWGVLSTSHDPSANAAYWQPVVRYLHAHLTPSYRVEAVDTVGHWDAYYLAQANIPLVRGWFRQDDFPENQLLYQPEVGRHAYTDWLHIFNVNLFACVALGIVVRRQGCAHPALGPGRRAGARACRV